MAQLFTYNGALITYLGTLATDPNCCCDVIDGCGDCCGKIQGGWLSGGILYYAETDISLNTVDVTVTTSTTSRYVCEGETVEITVDTNMDMAWVSWDPAFEFSSTTSSHTRIGDYSIEMSPGSTLTLVFKPCVLSMIPTFGLIQAGGITGTNTLMVDITTALCSTVTCCDDPVTCEPCCWYLVGGVWDASISKFVFFADTTEGYFLKLELTIGGTDPDNPRLTCMTSDASGEVMPVVNGSVTIHSRYDGIEDLRTTPETILVEFPSFAYDSASPTPTTEPVVGEPGAIVWTPVVVPAVGDEFTFQVYASCKPERLPGVISVSVKEGVDTIGSLDLDFQKCSTPEDCICCCPVYCCGDCYFPTDPEFCTEAPIPNGAYVGGNTQIVNLLVTVTSSPPGSCTDTTPASPVTFTQTAESEHFQSCNTVCDDTNPDLQCVSSNCEWRVPVVEDCPSRSPFYITVSWHTVTNEWQMGVGGAGFIYWVTGRTSYSGDCNGGTATGTFTSGIYTYTWETSFEVVRVFPVGTSESDCPEA